MDWEKANRNPKSEMLTYYLKPQPKKCISYLYALGEGKWKPQKQNVNTLFKIAAQKCISYLYALGEAIFTGANRFVYKLFTINP